MFVCSPLAFGGQTEKNKGRQKKSNLILLPIIYYTPETKLAGGLGGIYSFHTSRNPSRSRPSSILMSLVYTQKKQSIIDFGPDLYLKNEAYHLMGKIGFTNFSDRFYGIGKATSEDMKEDFTSRIFRINLNLQAKIRPKLYAGLQYELEHNDIVEVEEDGELVRGEILGTGGGTASGVGFNINRDARNNIFFPSGGDFFELSATLFRNGLGSSYDFTRYRLDLRKYFPLFSSHVLSLMGGPNWMRGYYRGRFRDKNMIVFQMEYRLPVLKRVGMVGFVGFGDVADKIDNFVLEDFKYSAGFGFRYLLSPEEKINVRFDFGFCKESFGFYIAVSEAF
jgi:hypothetical protein